MSSAWLRTGLAVTTPSIAGQAAGQPHCTRRVPAIGHRHARRFCGPLTGQVTAASGHLGLDFLDDITVAAQFREFVGQLLQFGAAGH